MEGFGEYDTLDLRLDFTRTAAGLRDCAWLLERAHDPAEMARKPRDLADDVDRILGSKPE